MTAAADVVHAVRTDAARIAYALLRMEEPMASPIGSCKRADALVLGEDAYSFTPSWELIPRADVVPFLVSLPCPALLAPTTTRGVIALTLLDELRGDRRLWAEKVLSNFSAGLDDFVRRLALTDDSHVRLDCGPERDVYSLAAVRTWTQQFGILQIAWTVSALQGDARAQAQLVVRRSDGQWFPSTQTDLSPESTT